MSMEEGSDPQQYDGAVEPEVAPEELATLAEELAKTSSKIESVELALGGRGEYLGITDKEKLLGQLEVLQTKEAQLQKKELLIMTAVAGASTAAPASTPPLPLPQPLEPDAAAPSPTSTRTLALPGAGLPSPVLAAVASPASSPAFALSLSSATSPPSTNDAPGVGDAKATVSSQGDGVSGGGGRPDPSTPGGPPISGVAISGDGAQVSQGVTDGGVLPPVAGVLPAAGVDTAVAQGAVSQGDISVGYGGGPVAAVGGVGVAAPPATLLIYSHQLLAQTPAPAAGCDAGLVATMPPTAPATGGYLHAPPSQAVPAVGAPAAPGVMVALAASTGAGYGAATAVGVELLGQASGTGVPTTAKRRASGEGTGSSKRRARSGTQCLHKGCTTARTFGRDGDKHASYCALHKLEGMVNIKGRRCQSAGCQHRPGFAMPGEKRGKFCATHREDGMVDVVSRKCQVEGGDCERQPVYGWPGERATRCGTHKLSRTMTNLATGTAVVEKMYDVRGKRCQEKGCLRQPGFGHPVKDKGPVRCHEHKLEGQTNVRKRRALERQARQSNPDVDYPPLIHSQAEILHHQQQLKQEQMEQGEQPAPPEVQASYGNQRQPAGGAGLGGGGGGGVGGGQSDSLPVPILPRPTAHAVASLGNPLASAQLPVAGFMPFQPPPPDASLPGSTAATATTGAGFGEGQAASAPGVPHVLFMMQQHSQQQQQQQYNGVQGGAGVEQPGQQQHGVHAEAPQPAAEPAAMAFEVPSAAGTAPAAAV